MADDKLRRGTILSIKLSDGASSNPVFTNICGLNVRSSNQSKNMNDFAATDCSNREKIKALRRVVASKGMEISGSGWFLAELRETMQEVFDDPDGRVLRFEVGLPLADGGGYYEGNFHMSAFNITGNEDEMITCELTFMSDGEYPWTDASA